MEFQVLGPVGVVHDGKRAHLGPQLVVLLAVLIAAEGRSVPNDTLREHLWREDEADHLATLRSHITHLRKTLNGLEEGRGALLVRDTVGYALRLAPDQLDAARFRRLYAEGAEAMKHKDADRAARLLRSALGLWRGPAYQDLREHAFAVAEASKLEGLRDAATVTRVEADLELGRHRDVTGELRQLAESDPANEYLLRLRALATYRTGDAERAAEICRVGLCLLHDEGIDAPELETLQSRILQRDPGLAWTAPTQAIFWLPPRGRVFSGRVDLLEEIDTELTGTGEDIAAVALHGLGGVGKTRLAIEYAHRHSRRYKLICWIPGDEPMSIVARLSELAQKLGVPEREHREDMIVELWEKLRQASSPWLLVYDNADAPSSLSTTWPLGGIGHVIVTSRNRSWGHSATPIEITSLNRADSISFVRRRLRGAAGADADQLATQLGGLPLALEQACAYIEATSISITSYLAMMRSDDAPAMLGLGRVSDYEQTVATTWSFSLHAVQRTEPAAAQLLQLGAFLGPLGIPRALVTDHAPLLPDPLRQAANQRIPFNAIIEVIGRYSLAEVTDELVNIHPLVQTVIRATLGQEEAARWAGIAIRLVDGAYSDDPADESSWALLSHAITASRHARLYDVESASTVSLLMKAARTSSGFGDPRQTADLLNGALDALGHYGDPDSAEAADILLRLGWANRELGALPEAQRCFERATELRRQSFGSDGLPVAEPLTGLGMVLFDLSRLEEARECLIASLAISEHHPEADDLDIATTQNVLGLVLWSLDDLEAATAAHRTSLRIRQERLGPDHRAVATSLDNLAKVIFDTGDLDEALRLNERALQIRETELGRDHYHVGISLNHLGYVLRDRGELDAALGAHQRAHDIFSARLGAEHSHVARSLNGIGAVLMLKNDLKAARQALADAYDIFTVQLGPEHPGTANFLADLAQATFRLGEVERGRAMMGRALDLLAAGLPPGHPEWLRVRDALAAMTPPPAQELDPVSS